MMVLTAANDILKIEIPHKCQKLRLGARVGSLSVYLRGVAKDEMEGKEVSTSSSRSRSINSVLIVIAEWERKGVKG